MPIGIPPFGLPVRKVARSYAAYADGVVYLVIYFANPKHEEPLELFLERQLSQNELRNAEIITRNETSEHNLKVEKYQFKKYASIYRLPPRSRNPKNTPAAAEIRIA